MLVPSVYINLIITVITYFCKSYEYYGKMYCSFKVFYFFEQQ